MSKKCSSRSISFTNISLDTAENESSKVCYRSFTHHNYTSCIPYLQPSVARATRSSVAFPPPWLLHKHRQAAPVQSGVRFLQNIGRTESHTKKGRWRLRFCFWCGSVVVQLLLKSKYFAVRRPLGHFLSNALHVNFCVPVLDQILGDIACLTSQVLFWTNILLHISHAIQFRQFSGAIFSEDGRKSEKEELTQYFQIQRSRILEDLSSRK